MAAEPHYVAKANDKVAARVRSSDGEENWILAEVVLYINPTAKYDVDDIDAEEGKEYVNTEISHICTLWKYSLFNMKYNVIQ